MNRTILNINTVNAADDLKATLEAKIAEVGSTPRKFKDWGGYNISNLDYSFPRLDTIVRICSELGMNEVTIRWK